MNGRKKCKKKEGKRRKQKRKKLEKEANYRVSNLKTVSYFTL